MIILARDEAQIIRHSIDCIRSQLMPVDELHVVADHCVDETASVAAEAGARVHRRHFGTPGKGQALSWWVQRVSQLPHQPAGVVVVDADSLAPEGFLEALRSRLIQGAPAVQALVSPSLINGDAVAQLAAFSEIMEQRIFDRFRSWMGWPGRLRGTGMAFQLQMLVDISSPLQTSVEDAELSLLLADRGVRVQLAHETCVHDPKPKDASAASRQRARWLKGQRQLLRERRGLILRLLRKGPGPWALLAAIFLKPRSFFAPLYMLMAFIGSVILASASSISWLGAFLVVPAAVNFLAFLLGLLLSPPSLRRSVLTASFRWHRFLLMWIQSARSANNSKDPWLRARPRSGQRIGGAPTTGR